MLFMGAAGWLCIIVHFMARGIERHIELLGKSR